ncbi:head-tail adaptor protein [Weissella muntiaci]|uniref:Head-tail adaptor protein n=1 Tax=Weissella muntiaci TaxID=2508881 RepID=A0A6C2C9R1_9LACO|nr:phage head closure protein [Weissella muntiaci]TYC50758.1 head-tail adaptor protein [Weissella muntiaci]
MKPSDFNHKAEFGKIETVKNNNTGSTSKKFVPVFSLWFAPKTRSIALQLQLQGTEQADTREIIVKHNKNLNETMLVKIDGEQYDIVNISSDDTNQIISYDYVTIKRVSG